MNKKTLLKLLKIGIGFSLFLLVVTLIVAGGIFLYPKLTENKSTSRDGAGEKLEATGESEIVELKDKEKYTLNVGYVEKEINGRKLRMLSYNKSIPGPLIKINQGNEAEIEIANNSDIDMTLHAHGIRMQNKFDGVGDITQKSVKPGESFTYKLDFKDPGIYWYHPHMRSEMTVEMGLYGNFLVVPSDTHYFKQVNRELPLILDDILLQAGQILPFSKERVDHTLMGRFGNVMLVNGSTNYEQKVSEGEVIRYYITNAANARTFNFTIPNAKMKLIGGDQGRYVKEEFKDELIISPGERYIVDVYFSKAGNYELLNKTPKSATILGKVNVSSEKPLTSFVNEFNDLRRNNDLATEIDNLLANANNLPQKSLTMKLDMPNAEEMMKQSEMMGGTNSGMGMMGSNNMNSNNKETTPAKIEWEDEAMTLNSMSNSEMTKWNLIDTETGKKNLDIKWTFNKGDKIRVKLFNDPNGLHAMQHPIHFHGQRFLVLNVNGKRPDNQVWKDTVLVQAGDTVELLVDFSNPGDWLLHCHILEHAESGMLSSIKVQE